MKKISYLSISLKIAIFGLFMLLQPLPIFSQETDRRIVIEDFDADRKLTKIYGNENELCRLTLEPKAASDENWQVIPFSVVDKFIGTYISAEEQKSIKHLITFNAGCTSLTVEANKNILINKTLICNNKNGPRDVSIKWKAADCK